MEILLYLLGFGAVAISISVFIYVQNLERFVESLWEDIKRIDPNHDDNEGEEK